MSNILTCEWNIDDTWKSTRSQSDSRERQWTLCNFYNLTTEYELGYQKDQLVEHIMYNCDVMDVYNNSVEDCNLTRLIDLLRTIDNLSVATNETWALRRTMSHNLCQRINIIVSERWTINSYNLYQLCWCRCTNRYDEVSKWSRRYLGLLLAPSIIDEEVEERNITVALMLVSIIPMSLVMYCGPHLPDRRCILTKSIDVIISIVLSPILAAMWIVAMIPTVVITSVVGLITMIMSGTVDIL